MCDTYNTTKSNFHTVCVWTGIRISWLVDKVIQDTGIGCVILKSINIKTPSDNQKQYLDFEYEIIFVWLFWEHLQIMDQCRARKHYCKSDHVKIMLIMLCVMFGERSNYLILIIVWFIHEN